MIAEVRTELANRLRGSGDAARFGPVFGAVPRWNSALEVPRYPFTFCEVFGARTEDGAWHDEEYGARVVTVMLPITEPGTGADIDPGDPVLTAQLAAVPGIANGIAIMRDTNFAADEESLASLVSFYAPPEIDEVLAVTSSYSVVEHGGGA